jgi:UDP-GlcNAc:undecaprenyl-phosphate GlcNAc-1-phosphate transferase
MLNIFLYSFVIAVFLTWAASRIAVRFDIMDRPDERKKQAEAVPLLGGVAVFAAFVASILINFHFSLQLKGVIAASGIMLMIGLVDDIRGLPASLRLLVQVVCSIIVIISGVRLNIIPDDMRYALQLESVVTMIWIVGITNAFNFMDGLDGLAGGLAIIAAAAFFVAGYRTGQNYFSYLNIALAGSCAGFLLFNFHPARIYLGDAGSGFIGFTLASLAVMGEWADKRPVIAFSVPVLVLAVIIFDVVYISVARITAGKVRSLRGFLEYVGRDHLHHRLMNIGFSEKGAVLFIYLISIIFSLGALVLKNAEPFQAALLLLQALFILFIVTILMLTGRRHLEKSVSYRNQLEEIQKERQNRVDARWRRKDG